MKPFPLHLAALALLCIFSRIPASGQAPAKPNIIVVFVDDLGYADIGPFGATLQKTPHLDQMAREGMKLTSFYAAPVCSVSRAQLLTGCYGVRISVPGVYGPGSTNGLNPAEFTIAERLKEQGYATLCVGKWHVGDQPDFLPTRQGFDHYLGLPYSNDMQRAPLGKSEGVVPLVRDEKVEELLTDADQSRLVERYTQEALGFIRAHQDKPFLLYFPHTAVHTPIAPGAAFQGKSANGRFGDWVEEVDWSTGRILDTLRELKMERRTLVIFTSDNGPWLVKKSDAGSALPLRGGKGSTWEGGVRVPTLAWWPGQIAPGSVSDTVMGTIDLLPTAVALAGGSLPATPVVDGRDISPVLLGKTRQSPRDTQYYFRGYELEAVRQGPWKLAMVPQAESMGLPKLPDAVSKEPRLYHLENDRGETTDVAAQNPDTVARLLSLARAMQTEIGGPSPKARRPAGVVETPSTLYPTQPGRRPGKPQ
jgi:arylsulfatase A-like enzyme